MGRLKLGVLISGRGSNLQALIEAAADPAFPAEVSLVISNEPAAGGLDRARAAGITTQTIPHRAHPDRATFEAALDRALGEVGVGLVCLAGFMRLLTADFVARWRDRLINIHPSLLPAFPGLDTHARAIAAGVRFSGCTVHYVRAAMDQGPILVQAVVPVREDDTADSLAARVLAAEHRAYPMAVRLIASGRVRIEDERATIAGAVAAETVLFGPRPD